MKSILTLIWKKFKSEHLRIGQCNNSNVASFEEFGILNIWTCELFQSKVTKEFVLPITRDDDEQWIVFKIL